MKTTTLKRTYLKSEDGNVAVSSAIALPVLLTIGFMALDYALLLNADQRLKSSAEAAALAAVNEAYLISKDTPNVDLNAVIRNAGEKTFRSKISEIGFADVSGVTITPLLNGNELAAVVDYSAKYDTLAMALVGRESFDISNQRRATISTVRYIAVNFLFDISASMGIGASPADIQLMENDFSCAFACHIDQGTGTQSTYDRARDIGATMRIDVFRDAAKTAIDTLSDNIQFPEQIGVGFSVYDTDLIAGPSSSDARSTDLRWVKNQIDPLVQMRTSFGSTNTVTAMNELVATLPPSGSGLSANDRVQYIIVLSDNIEDNLYWDASTNDWAEDPDSVPDGPTIDKVGRIIYTTPPSACDQARVKNINVNFVNIRYERVDHSDPNVNQVVNEIQSNLRGVIEGRLAQCAGSADNVTIVDDDRQIDDAIVEIIDAESSPLRLY